VKNPRLGKPDGSWFSLKGAGHGRLKVAVWYERFAPEEPHSRARRMRRFGFGKRPDAGEDGLVGVGSGLFAAATRP